MSFNAVDMDRRAFGKKLPCGDVLQEVIDPKPLPDLPFGRALRVEVDFDAAGGAIGLNVENDFSKIAAFSRL